MTAEAERLHQQDEHERQHPELERYRVGILRGFMVCGICHCAEPVDANGEFRNPCPRREERTVQHG